MKGKEGKSIQYKMRLAHRYVGFAIIGFVIIYCISGIVLTYRTTNYLKKATVVEKELQPGLDSRTLKRELRLKEFKHVKTEGDVVVFEGGTYNKKTGVAVYTRFEVPVLLKKLNSIHKTSERSKKYVITTIFSLLLLFLAISSFWMFKPQTGFFKKGIWVALIGMIIATVIVII